jgi:tetratricopeptide (TPR) repeat protein
MKSTPQRTQEILSKRIPFERCHQKKKFFFDSKTTLPSDSFEQKDFQKLISFYTQKLHESKSKQEASEFYHLRGCIYFDNFFYESALFDFQQAEEIDTNNPVLYYDLGCIYQVLDDVEKSEICTFKALELYPDFIFALDILSYCHKKKNNFVECLKFLNKIIELNPDYIPAYNAILRIYNEFNVVSQSSISVDFCFNKILKIFEEKNSTNYRYSYSIAIYQICQDLNSEEALKLMDSCVEMNPGL